MLNEERVRLETRLAIFEQYEGKEKLKASSYYKGDYRAEPGIQSSGHDDRLSSAGRSAWSGLL